MAEGFFNRFKAALGVDDGYDEDFDEEEMEEYEEAEDETIYSEEEDPGPEIPPVMTPPEREPDIPEDDYTGLFTGTTGAFGQSKPVNREPREHKVLNMQHGGSQATSSRKQFKLVVTEPKSFDECPDLVRSLRNKKPIIINLEKLNKEVARKIFDFLMGATFAIDGHVQRVSNNIFVFTPQDVDVLSGLDVSESNQNGNRSMSEKMRRK